MRYTPFDGTLMDIAPTDLAVLRDVHEGWYVEYKSEVLNPRGLAKTLSSFANQYGGWLFIGIGSDPITNAAHDFPGVLDAEVSAGLESLKNAAKDLLHPHPFYSTRVFPGPIEAIDLQEGRSIVAVSIPQGMDPPYVHNDGRIYMRVGDSSEPKTLTDRSTFDILSQRGEQARSRLAERILKSPAVSKAEDDQPYIQFSVLSDPHEVMGHWYSGNFAEFSEAMKERIIPFDNIYATSEGYIARQTSGNDPYYRTLTWEFSRHCHSFVTLPIPLLQPRDSEPAWDIYAVGDEFLSMLNASNLKSARILDMNLILDASAGILARHFTLVNQAGVKGPFYVKARIENVWRSIPFLDLPEYLDHISALGFPVVQDTDILTPPGISLETFVVLPEIDEPSVEMPHATTEGAVELTLQILPALGIPIDLIRRSAKSLPQLGRRRTEYQQSKASITRR